MFLPLGVVSLFCQASAVPLEEVRMSHRAMGTAAVVEHFCLHACGAGSSGAGAGVQKQGVEAASTFG